ncbi:MAG: GYD domain-containing protein (plasmid) [Candidatus Methanoperedens sp.]|nr:MAG: GYD domain-containing protein [Candidatus Methanoperedens sp.]
MPDYLLQVTYTPEAVAAMLAKPQNREEAIRPAIEKLGGEIKDFWFTFGKFDVVLVARFPDNVSTLAFSMAVLAAGSVKTFNTTPLLSVDESIEAMKKASKSGYKPPGK